jgi:AraC-like DNA-binding protein
VTWLARVLKVFCWYFAIIVGIVLIDFVLFFDASFNTFYYFFTRFYYYPLFVGIAALTYWLGMESYIKKGDQPQLGKPGSSPEKIAHLEALASRIRSLMADNKAYRNPELSLQSLADGLQVKPYLVSQCLKEVMATRFNDYINQLRIEELKYRFQDPEQAHYTLLSLAFESGFNSKASFQRAVKKFEGLSPSELRKKMT